jgi:hypothetical protein
MVSSSIKVRTPQSHVIQADVFFVKRSLPGFRGTCKKQPRIAGHVHNVILFLPGLAEQRAVKALRPRDIRDTENQMVDKVRTDHPRSSYSHARRGRTVNRLFLK